MNNTQKKDPRKVFSKTLMEIGKKNSRILAVSCDSASGSGMGEFINTYPERYIEVGISEQNAIGVCAGLAERGFIPIVSAIAPFISMRCYEQVRNDIGYSCMNVKIIGSSSGLSHSTLGCSHQAIEDICLMRSIPNMAIINPGDAYEVEMSLKSAIEHNGPVYIRMPRHPLEDIVDYRERSFCLGEAEEIKYGEDITLIATGTMVKEAQKASDILSTKGIDAGLINVHTIKPIDTEIIRYAYKKAKMLVTIEEHSVIGGLGSAVAEVIASVKDTTPLHIIGISDGATNVGPYTELLDSYSLTSQKLADKICEFFI